MRAARDIPNSETQGITDQDIYVYDSDGQIVLSKIYEDDEVVVIIAPSEPQLKEIIINLLKKRPMTIKELHEILSGLASEDKIRHALNELMEEGTVYSNEEGKYYAAQTHIFGYDSPFYDE